MNFNVSVICSGHEYPIWCIDESSNGCYAATGSRDTTARLWSYERKFPVKIYAGHTQDVDVIVCIYTKEFSLILYVLLVHRVSSKRQLFCHGFHRHHNSNVVRNDRKAAKNLH